MIYNRALFVNHLFAYYRYRRIMEIFMGPMAAFTFVAAFRLASVGNLGT